jgi:hypothetical protein
MYLDAKILVANHIWNMVLNVMQNQSTQQPGNADARPPESVRDALNRIRRELRELTPLLENARSWNRLVANERRRANAPNALTPDRTERLLDERQLAIHTYNQGVIAEELAALQTRYNNENEARGRAGRMIEAVRSSVSSVPNRILDLRVRQQAFRNDVLGPEERLINSTGQELVREATDLGYLQGLRQFDRLRPDHRLVVRAAPSYSHPPSYHTQPPSQRASSEANGRTVSGVAAERRTQLERNPPVSQSNGKHVTPRY